MFEAKKIYGRYSTMAEEDKRIIKRNRNIIGVNAFTSIMFQFLFIGVNAFKLIVFPVSIYYWCEYIGIHTNNEKRSVCKSIFLRLL